MLVIKCEFASQNSPERNAEDEEAFEELLETYSNATEVGSFRVSCCIRISMKDEIIEKAISSHPQVVFNDLKILIGEMEGMDTLVKASLDKYENNCFS